MPSGYIATSLAEMPGPGKEVGGGTGLQGYIASVDGLQSGYIATSLAEIPKSEGNTGAMTGEGGTGGGTGGGSGGGSTGGSDEDTKELAVSHPMFDCWEDYITYAIDNSLSFYISFVFPLYFSFFSCPNHFIPLS